MARRGALRASRLAPLFLTLQRNREWWSAQPLLSSGQRVTFQDSELVWQYVPGQGLQIHPLANFGKLNAYAKSRGRRVPERAAARRAAGDRGAARRRARVGVLLRLRRRQAALGLEPRAGHRRCRRSRASAAKLGRMAELLPAIQRGLTLFEQKPPTGVRVATGDGAHYAQYSFWPSLRIINGFVQSLVGLYDVAPDHRRRARGAAVRRRRPRREGASSRRSTPAPGRSTRAARSRASPTCTTTRCCATS